MLGILLGILLGIGDVIVVLVDKVFVFSGEGIIVGIRRVLGVVGT